MLFRKGADAHDLAGRLIEIHANNFGRGSLLGFAEVIQHPLTEAQLPNALSEWLFFGAYVVRQCVAECCGTNTQLRDAVLDEFLEQLYAGLHNAGVAESELPHVEHCVKMRFQRYDRANIESQRDPIYSMGLAASTLMFGETTEAALFAMLPGLQFADSMNSITKLFEDFKVTR